MSWFGNDIICFCCAKARRVIEGILTISEACVTLLPDSTAESMLLFVVVEDSCMRRGDIHQHYRYHYHSIDVMVR